MRPPSLKRKSELLKLLARADANVADRGYRADVSAIIHDAASAFPSIEITKDIHGSRLHSGDAHFTFRFRKLNWHAVVEPGPGFGLAVRSINCTNW